MASQNTVLILIPGTTGTTLLDPAHPGRVAWGGGTSEVMQDVKNHQTQAAEALLEGPLDIGTLAGWNPAVTAKGPSYRPFQTFFTSPPYGFQSARVAAATDLPATLAPRQLLGFAYDWRRDNTYTAGILRSLLEAIDAYYARQPAGNRQYQTWIVGHSMGGLVARSVLEPNAGSSSGWYRNIRGLITLGTPHLGAPMALSAILGKFLPFQEALIPADLATVVRNFVNFQSPDGPAFNSTYELLPPAQAGTNLPGFVAVRPGVARKSIFDLQSSVPGSSAANFAGAQAFFGTLTYTGNPAGLPPYYCAYGTLIATPTGYTYHSDTRTWAPTIAFLETGDYIVPAPSARFAGRSVAVTQDFPLVHHLALASNTEVLQWIAGQLNLPAVRAA